MQTNRAVWQDRAGIPGNIREHPISSPLESSQLLVKVQAWAINPCDFMLQDQEFPFVNYPVILGQDVAGIVEQVGTTAASKFELGDRVFGFSINNGFQERVVLNCDLTARIPEKLSFAEAAVFPLCVATSSLALFDKAYLQLPYPSLEPAATDKSVLIWGGSSAVGSNAIQLCKAAGLRVITTCSRRSFDYVKNLGADVVFDYNNPSVTGDIAVELDKGSCAGIYLAAGTVREACQVSHKSKQDMFVVSSNPVMPGDCPEGVRAKFTLGTDGPATFKPTFSITFGGFIPDALKQGAYKVAPPPHIIPTKGLDGIQEAMDIVRKGVSATKVVVVAT